MLFKKRELVTSNESLKICFFNLFCHCCLLCSCFSFICFHVQKNTKGLVQQHAQENPFSPQQNVTYSLVQRRALKTHSAVRSLYVDEMLEAQSIFICQGWQRVKLTLRFPLSSWDAAKLRSSFPLSSMIYWKKRWLFTAPISFLGSPTGRRGKGEMTSSAIFHLKDCALFSYFFIYFFYNLDHILYSFGKYPIQLM